MGLPLALHKKLPPAFFILVIFTPLANEIFHVTRPLGTAQTVGLTGIAQPVGLAGTVSARMAGLTGTFTRGNEGRMRAKVNLQMVEKAVNTHYYTLFALSDHDILSRGWTVIVIKYRPIIKVWLWCYNQSSAGSAEGVRPVLPWLDHFSVKMALGSLISSTFSRGSITAGPLLSQPDYFYFASAGPEVCPSC